MDKGVTICHTSVVMEHRPRGASSDVARRLRDVTARNDPRMRSGPPGAILHIFAQKGGFRL